MKISYNKDNEAEISFSLKEIFILLFKKKFIFNEEHLRFFISSLVTVHAKILNKKNVTKTDKT
jgi:hypothetical protein